MLLYSRLFILFASEQHKQAEKKAKSDIIPHRTGLHKIIGTLNLIFGSTPFGKNNWNQSLPVTMNELITPLKWNFGWLILPTAVLWSLHRCSMGFRPSGLIAGHFRTLQHFWVLFEVCFGSLSCWKTHDLRWRTSFLTLGPTLRSKIIFLNSSSDFMMSCTQSRHPVPEAEKQPHSICEAPPCLTVGVVLFS